MGILANMILDLDGWKKKIHLEFSEATEEMEIMLLLAILVHEYSLQQLSKKEVVMDFLARSYDEIYKTMQNQEMIENDLAEWKEKVRESDPKKNLVLVKLACLAVICILIRMQKAKGCNISKENLFAWLEKSWELGAKHSKVYLGTTSGSILSTTGIILDFGIELMKKDVLKKERKVIIQVKDHDSVDTERICPPGMEFCCKCGHIDRPEAFLKENKCPNQICPDPYRWDD